MCGLFGFVGRADPDKLVECAKTLTHRGPDAFSTYTDPDHPVFLAHCRLSIIDLSDRALQPMSSPDGQVSLVFNGEIYNFRALRKELEQLGRRFRTESDTEVILHAYEVWGQKCLERLNGMFAIAVWDRRKNQLLLARDRLGIKPLYVYRGHKFIAFASEPRALAELPEFNAEIDQHGLVTYLLYGYVIGRPSIWRRVERLPPGSWAAYDLAADRWTEGVFWKLENQPREWTLEDATDRLQELLDTVVAEHLVADVPIGVLLSGGLDSSLIAASAARHILESKRSLWALPIGTEVKPTTPTPSPDICNCRITFTFSTSRASEIRSESSIILTNRWQTRAFFPRRRRAKWPGNTPPSLSREMEATNCSEAICGICSSKRRRCDANSHFLSIRFADRWASVALGRRAWRIAVNTIAS